MSPLLRGTRLALLKASSVAAAGEAEASFPGDVGDGLLAWYKSDAGVTESGGAVSQWDDQSGSGYHLVQATAANKPSYSATDADYNNKPSLTFDGSNDVLATAGNLTYGPFTVFVVAKTTSVGEIYSREAMDELYTSNNSSTYVQRGAAYSAKNLAPSWGVVATPKTFVHRFNGTIATDIIRVNGVSQTFGSTVGGSSDPGTSTIAKRLAVGARIAGTTAVAMTIAEFIVYSRALSDTESADVESYLQARYAHY